MIRVFTETYAAQVQAVRAREAQMKSGINDVLPGTVRLKAKEKLFMAPFDHFPVLTKAGFSPEKWERRGQIGHVTKVHDNGTCTIVFADGVKMDFPTETVGEQIGLTESEQRFVSGDWHPARVHHSVMEDPHWPHHCIVAPNHTEEHFAAWMQRQAWRLPPVSKVMKSWTFLIITWHALMSP